MKIHKIEIKNFKGFADETFTFNPHFTVIIGENATGKTAILDALAVALGTYLLGIDEATPKRHIQKEEVRKKDFGDYIAPQTPVEIWAEGEIDDEKNLKWGRIFNAHQGRTTTKGTRTTKKGTLDEIAREHQIYINNKGNRVDLPVLAYYSTGRLWAGTKQRLQTKGKGSILRDAYYACIDKKPNPTVSLEWFYGYEMAVLQGKDKTQLELTKKAISEFIENWHEVHFNVDEEDLVGTRYLANNEKQRVPLHSLSDGQRTVVSLVIDLAYRCITLNSHLGEKAISNSKGVVLIDEIDQHLHPRWQRRIVGDLKRTFPNIQFIATTHSPFIVQSLASDEIISLGMKSDVSPNKLSIEEIVKYLMGVESIYSLENQQSEEQSTKYLQVLEGANKQNIQEIENQLLEIEAHISDPAVRAFLQMQKLKKQTQI